MWAVEYYGEAPLCLSKSTLKGMGLQILGKVRRERIMMGHDTLL